MDVAELLLSPIIISVVLLLILSILRLNVVFSIIISALVGGLIAGMSCTDILKHFSEGLTNGAGIAFNYAMLGAFSIAISRSGVTELLAGTLFRYLKKDLTPGKLMAFKYVLLGILTLAAISSQNLIPVHIAFIPVLIPPLLGIFNKLKLDRRMIACILTFGLITPYMVMPFGFGRIYLHDILIANINKFGGASGITVTADMAPKAMFIPALGMVAGLLIAVFISYRKPRSYRESNDSSAIFDAGNVEVKPWKVIAGIAAIVVCFAGQIWLDSLIIAALAGILVFVVSGVISVRGTQDIFTKGVYLMGGIGIVMIGADGFADVMNATGCVGKLVKLTADSIGDKRWLGSFIMLTIGLIITMGIGSSFATVPLIAAIYVPLCVKLGFSPLATVAIVGVAGALGDAGSPVSESVLGPTAGLNADGQHDHIYDSTVPTFIHFNIPLLLAGWLASMVL